MQRALEGGWECDPLGPQRSLAKLADDTDFYGKAAIPGRGNGSRKILGVGVGGPDG